jgi:hypothetical protein
MIIGGVGKVPVILKESTGSGGIYMWGVAYDR